jgi:hypothetical protein
MKTLIEIDRITWSKVKQYATVKDFSLSVAVEKLLSLAFDNLNKNRVSNSN